MNPSPTLPRRAFLALAALPVAALPAAAQAQTPLWPERPLRLIIPVAPGGSLDILGRTFARHLTSFLGQTVVAENHAGAGSNLAFELAARARPDGYTLLVASDPLAINPSLYARTGYDPVRDFTGISELVRAPQVLVVRNTLPAQDVASFLTLAKQAEGSISMGSQGNGSIGHLAGALLTAETGAHFTHVPYRGGGPAVLDVVAGHLDALLVTLPAAIEHIRGGRIRALAVSSAQRSAALPNTPTLAESGIPGFDVVTWQGIAAPAGTPTPILAKLHAGLTQALERPDVSQTLSHQGFTVTGTTPEAFTTLIHTESTRWPAIVRTAGARLD